MNIRKFTQAKLKKMKMIFNYLTSVGQVIWNLMMSLCRLIRM